MEPWMYRYATDDQVANVWNQELGLAQLGQEGAAWGGEADG